VQKKRAALVRRRSDKNQLEIAFDGFTKVAPAIVSETNAVEPSALAKLAPPGCWLANGYHFALLLSAVVLIVKFGLLDVGPKHWFIH